MFREYKEDYLRLRKIKEKENQQKEKETLTRAAEIGTGTEVHLGLVTHIPSGRELSDIYLKHPGNEDTDDESTVEKELGIEIDVKEEQNFSTFISQHKEDKSQF